MERCEECGFAYDVARALSAGDAIIQSAGELSELLGTTTATISSTSAAS